MNVFEDLIEELKEENLLEETVIDLDRSKEQERPSHSVSFNENSQKFAANSDVLTGQTDQEMFGAEATRLNAGSSAEKFLETVEEEGFFDHDVPEIVKAENDRDFFRKRAMEEVSSMQMVEHVLSGVEREHMKLMPVPYDDLEVKKALHRFLQVSDDPQSTECAEAEYQLLEETQNWYSALAERDKEISVANIRRFCENSKPALSSQALMSLARFYRNSPYSELVRSKFDFVMTRLFGREIDGIRRVLLFGRKEMIGHIKTLYENWSSVELFDKNDHQPEIDDAVSQFGQFAAIAEQAGDLEVLLQANVFDSIRDYKESIGELFYSSEVTAAAIDCNVRIGNQFVELIKNARETERTSEFEEKYGFEYDQLISNTTGKTLLLVELLNGSLDTSREFYEEDGEDRRIKVSGSTKTVKAEGKRSSSFLYGVNKWFLAFAVFVIAICAGIYIWADMFASGQTSAIQATNVDISTTELKQYLRMARSTKETLYAVTDESWDKLGEDQQKVFLKKVLDYANEKGLKNVSLINTKGRSVGYASADRVEILTSL